MYRVRPRTTGRRARPTTAARSTATVHGPCFQDYPHIGGDANGIYVSTNEYDLFGPNYSGGADLRPLEAGAGRPRAVASDVTLVENITVDGTPGFTVWPAISPAGEYSTEAGGTEYLLSTIAGDGSETGNPTGTARRLGVWALSNTASLNSARPALQHPEPADRTARVRLPAGVRPAAGPFPLGECINDTTILTPFGPGCWQAVLPRGEPEHDEVISHAGLARRPHATDVVRRRPAVGASGTAVQVDGELKAGIAWFRSIPKSARAARSGQRQPAGLPGPGRQQPDDAGASP